MKRIIAAALATTVALLIPLAMTIAEDDAKSASAAKEPEGKAIFLKHGCNSCHAMAAQGIERKTAAGAKAEPAAASTTSRKPPDLSAVGVERKSEWITKYLQKQETIDKKKHIKTFKGTTAELATLTTWLAEQKDAEAAKKAGASGDALKEAKEAKEEAKEAKVEAKEAKEDAKEALEEAKEAKEEAEEAKEEAEKK